MHFQDPRSPADRGPGELRQAVGFPRRDSRGRAQGGVGDVRRIDVELGGAGAIADGFVDGQEVDAQHVTGSQRHAPVLIPVDRVGAADERCPDRQLGSRGDRATSGRMGHGGKA